MHNFRLMKKKLSRAALAALVVMGKRIAQSGFKTTDLLNRAHEKSKTQKNFLSEIQAEFVTLLAMIKAWATGKYKKVPVKTIALAIGALLYFVSPIDAILDFIPGLGYLDDVAVMGFVIKQIKNDLDEFRLWQNTFETMGETTDKPNETAV